MDDVVASWVRMAGDEDDGERCCGGVEEQNSVQLSGAEMELVDGGC